MGKVGASGFVVAVYVGACVLPDPHAAGPTPPAASPMATLQITADAPDDWRGWEWLGMPLDAEFRPLASGAVTLFPGAGQPTCVPRSDVSKESRTLQSEEELKASMRVWKIPVGVSGGYGDFHTYGFYRAVQITHQCWINDATPMTPLPPDSPARYYAVQVFYGHSFWRAFQGDNRSLKAALDVPLGQYGTLSPAYENTLRSMTVKWGGRGVRALDGTALFVPPEQLATHYTTADVEEPIVVEYREIPSGEHPPIHVRVDFSKLHIGSTGAFLTLFSHGHCTYWSMRADCKINGQPQTSIPLLGQIDPAQGEGKVNVCAGSQSVDVAGLVTATDRDTLECVVSGEYSREGHKAPLGQATTGPIVVSNIAPSASGHLNGSEANTSYDVAWTMARAP